MNENQRNMQANFFGETMMSISSKCQELGIIERNSSNAEMDVYR